VDSPWAWYGSLRAPHGVANDLSDHEVDQFVDSNVIGATIGDVSGRIHVANDAALEMHGYTREDLLAQRFDWHALTTPEWQTKARAIVAQLSASTTCASFEKENFHKDGRRIPLAVNITRIRGTELMLCTLVDLSPLAHAGLINPRTSYVAARKRFGLTDREHEILALLLEGFTNVEMGALLGISAPTVSDHVQNIMRKVAVQKRGQLFKRVILE
jgi:PAS domain S-box-containing protein